MLFFLLACTPTPPDITSFDDSCSVAEDCVVVNTDTDVCACSCDFAALSVAGAAEWDAAVDRYLRALGEPCLLDCVACDDSAEAACEAGTCEVVR
jgi:hypothetical protein